MVANTSMLAFTMSSVIATIPPSKLARKPLRMVPNIMDLDASDIYIEKYNFTVKAQSKAVRKGN